MTENFYVTDYDENYVYLNYPMMSSDLASGVTLGVGDNVENHPVLIDDFLNNRNEGERGLYVLTKDGSEKTASEIIAELKTYAENTPSNLRTCADGIDNGTININASLFDLSKYGILRANVAIFLREQGLGDVATNYESSATKFSQPNETSDPTEVANILREIADLENQAYNPWS